MHPIEEVKAKIKDQVECALSEKTSPLGYTDDTALTFAMAESLVECKKYDEAAMAKKCVVLPILNTFKSAEWNLLLIKQVHRDIFCGPFSRLWS